MSYAAFVNMLDATISVCLRTMYNNSALYTQAKQLLDTRPLDTLPDHVEEFMMRFIAYINYRGSRDWWRGAASSFNASIYHMCLRHLMEYENYSNAEARTFLYLHYPPQIPLTVER